MVPVSESGTKYLGKSMRWTRIPTSGEPNTPCHLMLLETELHGDLMGHPSLDYSFTSDKARLSHEP